MATNNNKKKFFYPPAPPSADQSFSPDLVGLQVVAGGILINHLTINQ